MPDERRIEEILDELGPDCTPEDLCGNDPELLSEVHRRWDRMRRLVHQLDDLFPEATPTQRDDLAPAAAAGLPRIEGYEIEGVIGRGGMGVIFKAYQRKLNRLVALKMLASGPYAGSLELARFRREIEAVAALKHPNIVQIHDVGELAGGQFFTMEYVEGGTLAAKLGGKIQDARGAAEVVAALACAVQFAHKSGFIHRDIKPANILLTADGIPKIADFGLARPIDDGPELTMSGARVGTPSYMAPEQARGHARAIGPAVDIYSLGAVLYEMLAGRPPFDAESAAEIVQQVIHDDPIRPSETNRKTPRDLETICLKCLQKNPSRRYASAQDLADDLHRYLDGKPVLARPVNMLERTAKWARRRPTAAMLGITLLFAFAVGAVLAGRLQADAARRRERAHLAAGNALNKADDLRGEERWHDILRFLPGIMPLADEAQSDDLRARLAQALTDAKGAAKLETVRQDAMVTHIQDTVSLPTISKDFTEALAELGIEVDGDLEKPIQVIKRSAIRAQILAAIDTWAYFAFAEHDQALQDRLLHLARRADPDSDWGNRLRDAAGWRDRQRLVQQCKGAIALRPTPPVHQIALLAALLRGTGMQGESLRLLNEAQQTHRGDFWLNLELGRSHYADRNFPLAVHYFRTALALRKRDEPAVLNALGAALIETGQGEEALAALEQAIAIKPDFKVAHHNRALMLLRLGRKEEALDLARRRSESEQANSWAQFTFGVLLCMERKIDDGLPRLRKAVALDPEHVLAWKSIGMLLSALGRPAEAIEPLRKTLARDPTNSWALYYLAVALSDLAKHQEAIETYREVVRLLDPAERTGTLNDHNKFHYLRSRAGLAHGLLALERFAEANQAIHDILRFPGLGESERDLVLRQLEICRQLSPLQGELGAIVAGKGPPRTPAIEVAVAEWLFRYKKQSVSALSHYRNAFTGDPTILARPGGVERFDAGCAAALAGCGTGPDAAKLDDAARTELLRQSLAWLKATHSDMLKSHARGSAVEQASIARTMRDWFLVSELAGVRADDTLAFLPKKEREDWRAFWNSVSDLAARDPFQSLDQARVHVHRREWAKAAEIYALQIERTKTLDGEVWFECAAAQLLCGDNAGYRATCARMFEGALKKPKMRAYLLARVSTLSPDWPVDPALPTQVGDKELKDNATSFWSLTEQAALLYRSERYKEAIPYLEKSIVADPRPGSAVLNWLWLALAHHKLGDGREARHYLDKATIWLDALHGDLPAEAEKFGIHRHNWLEAYILRREAESLMGTRIVAPGVSVPLSK